MEVSTRAVLLFDGGCGVCRRIAHWVQASAGSGSEVPGIIVRPVGQDVEELKSLNPALNIWDAYATVHVLMPDGTMRLGGEAVAEVLRRLPSTRWFARCFDVEILGITPFQAILNGAYVVLDDVRPIFGCESCGTPSLWIRPLAAAVKWFKMFLGLHHQGASRHATAILPGRSRLKTAFNENVRNAPRRKV